MMTTLKQKLTILLLAFTAVESFTLLQSNINHSSSGKKSFSTELNSFYSDSSDYKSSDSDFASEDEDGSNIGIPVNSDHEEEDVPTIEETPVPMSKNSGSRFVAFIYDNFIYNGDTEKDIMDLHEDRIALTEDHVMFCRKANLYNETFNSESMADVLWSHQLLSSDMKRVVGHAMCIESTKLEYAKDLLSRDPIVKSLSGGDISKIPFYRWRHIRDITLRQDDGREGVPFLLMTTDRSVEEGIGNLRETITNDNLEYLIRSERVIATGPLYLPTEFKDDPSSIPVGDVVIFNARSRDEAIAFSENSPSALSGLYSNMKLNRFNSLDVTGKFVAENLVNPDRTKHTQDMKEALEYWGYPVDDRQTNWLNW